MKTGREVDPGYPSWEGSKAGSLGNHPLPTPRSSDGGHQDAQTLGHWTAQHRSQKDKASNPNPNRFLDDLELAYPNRRGLGLSSSSHQSRAEGKGTDHRDSSEVLAIG